VSRGFFPPPAGGGGRHHAKAEKRGVARDAG